MATVLLSPAALAGNAEDWTTCEGDDHAKAIAACTSLIENIGLDASERAEAFLDRGLAYDGKGDHDRAIADYNEAIRLKPDDTDAFLNRGNAYDDSGDHNRAIADYNEAIRQNPDDASAYFERGIAYYRNGDRDGALADYSEAIRLKPDYANALYNRGLVYYYKGDYNHAIADFSEAIRLKPSDANAYANRGLVYIDKGDYDHALADYSEAIRLKPGDASAYVERGIAYDNKGDYDRAIADYNEAIRLKPGDANAFYNRGGTYSRKDDHDHAIADYSKAIRLKPGNASAYVYRGVAYDDKDDHNRAVADYKMAIRLLKPNDAGTFYDRGTAHLQMGDYDRAIADYDEAIRLKPDDAFAFNNRGVAYDHKGDYDRAIADYNKAIRLTPDDALAIANRGIARWQIGQQDDAITDLQQALKLNPSVDYARTKLNEFQNTIEAGKARRRTEHVAGRRVALVIGNSDYRFLPKLPNAVHDAEAVRDALIAQGFEVTFLRDLPLAETITALDKFRKSVAPSAEKALIWYTGHGQSFQVDSKASKGAALQSDNFILPIDFKTGDDVVKKGVVLGDVINGVLPAGTVQVVVIDACRSIGEKGAPVGFKGTAKPTTLAQGVEPLTSDLVVVYSTQPGHSSFDGVAGQHSPFAQAFIDQMKEGGAQADLRAFFLSVGTVTNNNAAAIGKEQVPDVTSYITTPKLMTLGPGPK